MFAFAKKPAIFVANVAFGLGILCFVYPFFINLTDRDNLILATLIAMYLLFLLNAIISANPAHASLWAVLKGFLAFGCGALGGMLASRLPDTFIGDTGEIALLHFCVLAINLLVIILPCVGFARRQKHERCVSPSNPQSIPKEKEGQN